MSNGNGITKVLPYVSLVGVIVVAISAGIAWGGQNETVKNNGNAIKRHDERIERVENAISKQTGSIRVLEERSANTRDDVQEIKQGVQEMLKRLPAPEYGPRR